MDLVKDRKRRTKKESETATKAPKSNGSAPTKLLRPIQRKYLTVRIAGTSPLIQHKWSEKATEQMRQKHSGDKTKNRDARDPQAEGEEASYRTVDGKYSIPILAVKSAIISAAHKDLGIEKTLVKKSVFVYGDATTNGVLPMDCDKPTIQEDHVRVGQGSADLRYRPYFYKWALTFEVELDAELMKTDTFINLLDRAGFGVGIGEWRPEKGGEFGRFEVDSSFKIKERTKR